MLSSLTKWLKENKLFTVFIVFFIELAIAKLFGDFDTPYYKEFPKTRILYNTFVSVCLGVLSVFNIYSLPRFIRWFQSNERQKSVRLAIFGGVFGSFFCAPLVGIGAGLAFALFLTLTVVNTFAGLMKQIEG